MGLPHAGELVSYFILFDFARTGDARMSGVSISCCNKNAQKRSRGESAKMMPFVLFERLLLELGIAHVMLLRSEARVLL